MQKRRERPNTLITKRWQHHSQMWLRISAPPVEGGGQDGRGFRARSGGEPNIVAFAGATAPVPEPASWVLTIMGFAVAGLALRRRQGATAAVIRISRPA